MILPVRGATTSTISWLTYKAVKGL